MYSIRKHLRVGCATCSGLFIGRLSALTLHLAAIDVNRLPNLTLDRRPILTLLSDVFWR
jgi:hypothetical protein